MFGFDFAPRFWAFCNGQLLPINQNQALFSLLGTTYGGNGTVTFGLPDLRGKSMVHIGQGPGLSNIVQGETAGVQTVTLSIPNMPLHTHSVSVAVNAGSGTSAAPTDKIASSLNAFSEDATSGTFLGGVSQTPVGQNQPFSVVNPYIGIFHSIALSGIFPSRN